MRMRKLKPKTIGDWIDVEEQAWRDALIDSFKALCVEDCADSDARSQLIKLAIQQAERRKTEFAERRLSRAAVAEYRQHRARTEATMRRLLPIQERTQYRLEELGMIDRHDERYNSFSYLCERAKVYLCGKRGFLPYEVDEAVIGTLPDLLAEDAGRPNKPIKRWEPPAGYVSVQKIMSDERFRKNGKNPQRSTIQRWMETRGTKVVKHPHKHLVHVPEEWAHEQIERWTPRNSSA